MILLDDNTTMITGDAMTIVTELALAADRAFELLNKASNDPDLPKKQAKRFVKLVQNIRDIRTEINPSNPGDVGAKEILASGKLPEIYPEEFFAQRLGQENGPSASSTRDRATPAADALRRAQEKLEKKNSKNSKKGN